MGRGHAVAIGVEQQSRKQAWVLGPFPSAALDGIGGEPSLHRAPKLRLDDRPMLSRIVLVLVDDLAVIDPVLQHQIKRAACDRLAAPAPAGGAGPLLADNSLELQLVPEQTHRAQREGKMCRTVSASPGTMTSLWSRTRYPSGGMPPIHMPFFFEAAILSRI